jgi:hypothetical protein
MGKSLMVRGMSLLNIKIVWKLSSVGRASALQAGGHRFEPYSFHLRPNPIFPTASDRKIDGRSNAISFLLRIAAW